MIYFYPFVSVYQALGNREEFSKMIRLLEKTLINYSIIEKSLGAESNKVSYTDRLGHFSYSEISNY